MRYGSWPLYPVFYDFCVRQVGCLDYDPFHPVLWTLEKDMDKEQSLWMSTLYMAFYSMGSAWIAYNVTDPLQLPPVEADKWHIGLQRRNLRASSVRKYLSSFCLKATKEGGIEKFLTKGFGDDPSENWHKLIDSLESVWGNGRWGAYTTAELYQKVNGLNVKPADLGIDGASGPRRGLILMTGDADNEELEARGKWILQDLKEKIPVEHIPYCKEFDLAMVESLLCDFYGMTQGRYYVGRDVDRMYGRMQQMINKTEISFEPIFEARKAFIAKPYLAELCGREGGIDLVRKKAYKQYGVILDYKDDYF